LAFVVAVTVAVTVAVAVAAVVVVMEFPSLKDTDNGSLLMVFMDEVELSKDRLRCTALIVLVGTTM
jgi:hypothetical protein